MILSYLLREFSQLDQLAVEFFTFTAEFRNGTRLKTGSAANVVEMHASALSSEPPANTPTALGGSGEDAVFEAHGVTKSYDDGHVQALRGLDFRIEAGEFVAITGPSGCGKSTLLQMLGALDRPSGGALLYRGKSLADLPDPALYRSREIGFIFQAFHLLPTFTALENVQMPMFGTGRSARDRRERAATLLEAVGLAHRHDHLPNKLSGGERQRVAIARSLANEPAVLLADEPTGNLDSENALAVLELLARLQREHRMTLVLVTHDPQVAAAAARTIRLADGRVVSSIINHP